MDGGARCAGSGVHGRAEVPCDSHSVIWVVAGDACLDCWIAFSCGAAALPGFEFRSRGLVGEDELQPVFVAAVVCVWGAAEALVFSDFGDWGGSRVVLPIGAADDTDAGAECGAAERSGVGGGSVRLTSLRIFVAGVSFAPSGLHPFTSSPPTAGAVGCILAPLRGFSMGTEPSAGIGLVDVGSLGELKGYSALVVLFARGIQVEVDQRNLTTVSRRQIVYSLALNGVVVHFERAPVFEHE